MPIVRQTSFSGGELSPTMYGRTDLDKYRSGVRQLLNFLPTPFGSVQNRPGTEHCGALVVPSIDANGDGQYEAVAEGLVCYAAGTGTVFGTSPTGTAWTAAATLPTGAYYGTACHGTTILAVGNDGAGNGVVLRSVDGGTTWSSRTVPIVVDTFRCVYWDAYHARWWVGGNARAYVLYSDDDGLTWSQSAFPTPTGTTSTFAISSDDAGTICIVGMFIYTGGARLSMVSADNGASWSYGPYIAGIGGMVWGNHGLTYDGGYWITTNPGYSTHRFRSTDGLTWADIAGVPSSSPTSFATHGGLTVSVGTGTNRALWSSDQGATWTAGTGIAAGVSAVIHNGLYWIAVGTASTSWYSTDGKAWTAVAGFPISAYCVGAVPLVTVGQARRLIPFVFSDDQALVMEFGHHVIRFWEDGALVPSAGSPYQVVTPYDLDDLPYLKYAQMGNVITLACRGYAPYELTRTSAAPLTFTLTAVTFAVPESPIPDVVYPTLNVHWASVSYDSTATPTGISRPIWWGISAICQSLDGTRTWETKVHILDVYADVHDPVWSAATTYAIGDRVRYTQADGVQVSYVSKQNANLNNAPATDVTVNDAWWSPTITWGAIWVNLDEEQPVIQWKHPVTADYRVIGWSIYRYCGGGISNPGVPGWVADVLPGNTKFCDDGSVDPDFSRQPVKGQNPFEVYDEDDVLVRTEYPNSVAYHDERLVFGGTEERPHYVFASRLGDWHNFDQYPIVKADDAIIFGLACRRYEEIRSLSPGRSLLAFSSGSEWAIDGGQPEAPIIPTSLTARVRSERGSTWLDALKTHDEHTLFVQKKGTLVQDMAFDGKTETYAHNDLTLFCRHLVKGHEILDWCWSEDPFSTVWLVRDDGVLLSMTFMPESGIVAWARHELGGAGKVESVCSIPEGEEDVLYLLVRRGTVWTIERMTTRQISDSRYGCFLDSSLSFTYTTPTTAVTGLTHLDGAVVYALADGIVRGPFTVAGGAITLPVAASIVHVGRQYNSDFESLDAPPGEGKAKMRIVKAGWLELEASAGSVKVGPDFVHLETWSGKEADESAAVLGLKTGLANIPMVGKWAHNGRVAVRQSDPLPITILSITREIEYGP